MPSVSTASDGFIANWENAFNASESYDVSYSVVQTSSVTVDGIDLIVTYNLTDVAAVNKLAHAFDVSDVTESGDQDATLRRRDAGEASLKEIITTALQNAVNNSSTIQDWIKSEYLDDFFNDVSDTTFANYFENVNISNTELFVDCSGGAESLWDNLALKEEELDDLLMQMPESNFPNSSVSGRAPALSYLPLKSGNSVVFLFRVTVSAQINRTTDNDVDISSSVGGTVNNRTRADKVVSNTLTQTPLVALKLTCNADATE